MYGWGHSHVIGRLIDVRAIVTMEWGGWWFVLWLGWACARVLESSAENVASVGSRSKPAWLVMHLSLIPPLVPSPSPAASGPQSLDGIGWLLSDAKNVEVVAWTLEEVPSCYSYLWECGYFLVWLIVGGWGWFEWLWLWRNGCGCEGTEVKASLGRVWWYVSLFRIPFDYSIGKFSSCQFPPITVSYCILLTHILTTS